MPSPVSPIPGKTSNKTYEMQGWNAARAGHGIAECPYYATSTAEKYWKKGFRSIGANQGAAA